MYKIKRLTDGLFSAGGQYPYFTKRGKVWSTLQGLKLHLNQFCRGPNYEYNYPSGITYRDCIVIKYDDENGGIKEDVFNIIAYLEEKQKELLARRKRCEEERKEYTRELAKLKEKYGML